MASPRVEQHAITYRLPRVLDAAHEARANVEHLTAHAVDEVELPLPDVQDEQLFPGLEPFAAVGDEW